MEFTELVRARRMTRAFTSEPIPASTLTDLFDLALRSPSAGKTQGIHFVVLQGIDKDAFWNDTLPQEKRESFRWQKLLDANVIILPCVDPQAYVDRYSESDKSATGLGTTINAWPTPYWTVDGSFAVMTMLLAAQDAGLGALFFAVFNGEEALRKRLGIPDGIQMLGAVALGHPAEKQEKGRSASRSRKKQSEVVHHSRW